MRLLLFSLFFVISLVLFSVSVQAFEIQNLGADFSVPNQFEAKIYFENNGREVIGIQANNDFGYFNRFTKLRDNSYKWDLVFDRTGRSDIEKIIIIFPETTVTGNTVTINNFVIGFQDAINQGFTVEVNQLGNDSQVILSDFLHISGVVTIDPTIIDTSEIGFTNYGNLMVRDSSGNIFIVQEVVVSSSNTDIFVSKSTNDGNSFTTFNLTNTTDFNESLPHIDINSDDGLIIAYDKSFGAAATLETFVTTCSAGGCDSSGEFLSDINVSECGASTACRNSNIVTDVNDTSHVVYWNGDIKYRTNTGFVGSVWGAEEATGVGGTVNFRDGVGILVAKNGDDRKLVFSNTDSSQVRVGYFNTFQWTALQLDTDGIQEPVAGFAGYDGNFYLVYTKTENIIFRQCDVTSDCNVLGNWTSDVNVTNAGLEREFVSMFQSADLNLHVYSSPTVGNIDVNIMHFVRTPNNSWVTSSIADANVLVSDSNRTYNPLVRSRGYDGSVLPLGSLPTTGNLEFDFVYLTSDMITGDPSTLIFDSNIFALGNTIAASFTTTPASPIALDPENGINNVQVDLNSSTTFFGPIVDINYNWQIDSNAIGVSTDANLVWDFNGGNRDINVSLIVQGNDGSETFTSQTDQNVLLRINAQNIDINFVYNDFVNNVDVNFGVTATGTINYAVWGFPNDQNQLGIDINKTFTTDGIKQVCVIVNTTGDLNKLDCENFTSTRVLVKRPLDKVTSAVLTPFTVSTNDITRQSYSSQTADLNVFLFFQSGNDQNILFTVDFNSDYFSSTYLIGTNDVNTFQTIQPFLVLISQSVSSVFHVINAITQNTIPDVVIESRQGGVLIESTITDSTGSATLNFIVADTYDLTFIFQGVISLEQQIRPIDTEYFIYLFLEQIITEPANPETITVDFDPSIGQVQEGADGNFTLTQVVAATRGSITLINIQVDQNGVLFFDSNFTGVPSGGTFSQDFNVSMFESTSPIGVTVIITSSLIDDTTKKSISYFIQFTSQDTFLNAINDLGVYLGDVGRLILVILSSFVIVGGFSKATGNPNILASIVLLWMGAFTAIGLNENYVVWVPVPVFLFALIGAVAIYLNR